MRSEDDIRNKVAPWFDTQQEKDAYDQALAWVLSNPELSKTGITYWPDLKVVAVYHSESLSWIITGSFRAWGDPTEIIQRYGTRFEIFPIKPSTNDSDSL